MFHIQVNIQCFTHPPFLFHVQVNIQCFTHPPFMFHVQVNIQCFTHPSCSMFRLIFSASPIHPSCSMCRLIFSASLTHPSCSMFRLIFSASLTLLMLHIFFLFSASLSHPSYVPCPGFSYSSFALRIFHVHVLSQCFTHPPFVCVFHIQVPIQFVIHSPLYMFMFQFCASHRSYIIKIKINLKDCVYYISAKNKGGKKSLVIKTFQNNIRNAINTDCTSIRKLLLVWFCVVNTWIWKSDCSSSAIQHTQTCFAYIYYNITDSKWKKELMLEVHISWHTYFQPPARQTRQKMTRNKAPILCCEILH